MLYDPGVVAHYLFSQPLRDGVWITIQIAVLAQVIGVFLGLAATLARRGRYRLPRWAAHVYVWFFRGTPVYVQLLFWYVALAMIDPFAIALLALGLNEGAYMAEIVRAGLDSVDHGQKEAALSLGMTDGLAMRRIILPQALRVIIPPTGNEFISMLKTSSLASTISLGELLFRTQNIYQNASGLGAAHALELLTAASLYYLALTSVFSLGQSWLERHLGTARAIRVPRRALSWRSRLAPDLAAASMSRPIGMARSTRGSKG